MRVRSSFCSGSPEPNEQLHWPATTGSAAARWHFGVIVEEGSDGRQHFIAQAFLAVVGTKADTGRLGKMRLNSMTNASHAFRVRISN